MSNFFYDLNSKLACITGKRMLHESACAPAAGANPGAVPKHLDEDQVETKDYSWGQLKVIRHGKDYSLSLIHI